MPTTDEASVTPPLRILSFGAGVQSSYVARMSIVGDIPPFDHAIFADTGDIDGVPGTVVQVANWGDVARAVREKPNGAEAQRVNAEATFACTWVRFRGGTWRPVLTPEQWATYHRETL